jgi:Domain of unknown function (DUF4265)
MPLHGFHRSAWGRGKRSKIGQIERPQLVEIWFNIEKDADGYPESKSREGLLASHQGENFRIESVPFYLKNVSRGDVVSATHGELLEFHNVVERGGHNTCRLLIKRRHPDPSYTLILRKPKSATSTESLVATDWIPPNETPHTLRCSRA